MRFIANIFILALLAVATLCLPVNAQVATFVKTDIGSPGATGSYSFSSGTYTVSGAGSGVGDYSDSFCFASTVVAGPGPAAPFGPGVEMTAKVATQSNTSNYAASGIMFRDSLNANGASAFLSVSPSGGNGVNLTVRSKSGTASTVTLGPSLSVPVFLRLVLSNDNVAGYQSADGIVWTLVGRSQITLPPRFEAGFAVTSAVPGTLSTATFTNAALYTNVPQRSANMLLWLRSDSGIVQASGSTSIDRWTDNSQYANHAVSSGNARPTTLTSAVNGLPSVKFNGTTQFLQLPSSFGRFSDSLHIIAVIKTTTGARTLFDVSNGTTSADVISFSQESNIEFRLQINDSVGTVSEVRGAQSNAAFQVLEAKATDATAVATLYKNSTVAATASDMNNIEDVDRTSVLIGKSYLNTQFFNGEIAELLVFRSALSDPTRKQIENYLHQKFGFGTSGLAAPVISEPSKVFTEAVPVSITTEPGTVVRYTLDGTDPGATSPVFDPLAGFVFTQSTILKAVATAPGLANSPISVSNIQIDPNASVVFRDGLLYWIRADNGITLATGGVDVQAWADVSGNGHVFSQATTTKQPDLLTATQAGLPTGLNAIDFVAGANNPHLKSTSNFNSWSGSTIFAVVYPTDSAPSGTPRFLDMGTGTSAQDNLGLSQPAANNYRYFAYNGTTVTNCTHTSGFALNTWQLLTATQDNATQIASVFKNASLGATTSSFSVLQNTARTSNVVGANSAGTGSWKGRIAEIIVYNRKLSDDETDLVQRYLAARYRILAISPRFVTPVGMYSVVPHTVKINVDPGASAYYTVDGSSPDPDVNPSAIPYPGQISLAASARVRAINKQASWTPPATSTISESFFGVDATTGKVPSAGLKTWLRSDVGVVTSSGSVTSWIDLSNTGHTPTAASNNPTLVTNAYKGFSAVNFANSPSQQLMNFPAGAVFDFTAGDSMFVIAKLDTPVSGGNFLEFTQSTNVVSLAGDSSSNLTYTVSPSGGSISGSVGAFGVPMLLEVVHDDIGPTATSFKNGAQIATNTVPNSASTSLVGKLGKTLKGQIFEVLVFDRALSSDEKAEIERYAAARYSLLPGALPDPEFSINSPGNFTGPTPVAIGTTPGASLYVTVDGSTPTENTNLLYQGPILVFQDQMTIKALAVDGINKSAVVSKTYAMADPTKYPPASLGGTTAPTINLQLPIPAQ